MINAIELQNFKNFRTQRIELEPLTVFVGANDSGKTSVLNALDLAVKAAAPTGFLPPAEQLRKVFSGSRHCDWIYTRGGSGDLSISCTTPGGVFTVAATPPADFPPAQIENFGKCDWKFSLWYPEGESHEEVYRHARSMVFLQLDASRLAAPSYSDRNPPCIEHTGESLASALAYMALNDPDGFDKLVDEMRGLIPHLKRIRFTKSTINRVESELVRFGEDTVERKSQRSYQGDAMLFDFDHATNIAADNASEGTLMLLGLLTVLLGPTKPDILLLDDIEHGLHPLAQRDLLKVLGRIMESRPQLQIVASSHSPYLLDWLQPEQVRLVCIGKDGDSICGRLLEHPKFPNWKDEMAPGELWSLFGEKWLAEGGDAK